MMALCLKYGNNMYRKRKVALLVLTFIISGCSVQNSDTANENISVTTDSTMDNVTDSAQENSLYESKTSKEIISSIENKINEISEHAIIRGIDFYEDYAYILSSDKETGIELLRYDMQTGESNSKKIDIKAGDTENIYIHNDRIVVDNILDILDSGTVIVLDTSMNQIAEYNDISGVYTYNNDAMYYYKMADNSFIEDRDGEKKSIRRFDEDTVYGNQIIDIDKIEIINNEFIYAQVSYFGINADESSYGVLKMALSDKAEDTLDTEAGRIIAADNTLIITDREESVIYGQQSTLTTQYTVVSINGDEQERNFEDSKEAELIVLSNSGEVMITDAKMIGRIYDVTTGEVEKVIDNEENEWFIYAKICEKYKFIMNYEYDGEVKNGADIIVHTVEY